MKRVFLYIIPLFFIIQVHAQEHQEIHVLKVSANAGYATEKLSWSIAGNAMGTNPNIYSELIWKDLNGTAVNFNLKYIYLHSWFIEGQYRTKNTASSWVSDIDYEGDNRTSATYSAILNTRGGSSNNLSIGTGYNLKLTARFTLANSIGYVRDRQHLAIVMRQKDIA